jgi:EamA-like transporter family
MAPRSLARLALLALLWGSSFLWIKLALDGLSPVQLVLVRLALGAAVLVLVVRVRRLRLPRDRTTWLRLTVAAQVANAIPYLLFAIGEQTVSSSLAGALNATTPLWTLGIGLAARTERQVTPVRVVGLLVGFAGALVILAPWNAPSPGAIEGALACLGAGGQLRGELRLHGPPPRRPRPLAPGPVGRPAHRRHRAPPARYPGRRPATDPAHPRCPGGHQHPWRAGHRRRLCPELPAHHRRRPHRDLDRHLSTAGRGRGARHRLPGRTSTAHLLIGTGVVLVGIALVQRRQPAPASTPEASTRELGYRERPGRAAPPSPRG